MKKLLILFILNSVLVFAQEPETKSKLKLVSQSSVGVLLGQDPVYSYRYSPVWGGPIGGESELTDTRTVGSLSFETFLGYKILPKLAAGITTGADLYNVGIIIPLAAGVRYQVFEKGPKAAKIQLGADLGYGFTCLMPDTDTRKNSGGLTASPKLSFIFPGKGGSAFMVNVVYKHQTSSYLQTFTEDPATFTERSFVANRLGFSLGFQF